VAHGSGRGEHRVALTFDAEHPDRRSSPGVQERLLELLDRLDVRATFFLQGRWAEAYPQTARLIPEAGHLVGNHSHYHARMPHLSDDGLTFDLRTAEEAIVDATGVDPKPWFRCPFGDGADDPRVLAAVAAAGYRHVGWTAEGYDFEPDPPVEELERLILDGVRRKPDDAIVLLHTWPHRTERALPGIVARLRDDGAELVRVDELAVVEALPAPEVHGAAHLQAE
jgi:peptidoglycan/xylan/chitin deacetylase (PgdA/CDA1 family)